MVIKEYTAKKAAGILKHIRFQQKTDIEKVRAAYDKFYGTSSLSHNIDIKEIIIANIATDIFNPEVIFRNKVILYLHGGCFTTGSRFTSRNICCSLCHESGARVFCPEYRLAPEHPFPAALEDAYAVYNHLLTISSPDAITFAGSDSGAALAAALILQLKEKNCPLPGSAVFFSPWLDLLCSGNSYAEERKNDPVMTMDHLQHSAQSYTYKSNLANPLVSPLSGNIRGFPPLLIQCGQHEILRDDATRFAAKAEAAGVPVTLEIYPGMWHLFQASDNLTSLALTAMANAGAFVRQKAETENDLA